MGSPLPAADEEIRRQTLTLTEGRGEIGLLLDAERRWLVEAASPGFWSRPVIVEPDAAGPVRLTLWPATTVEARLASEEEAQPLDQVELRLEEVPASRPRQGAQPGAPVEITCPVEERRIAGCVVPEGRWNVRVQVTGFAPAYVWAVRAEAPEPLALGPIALKRGGSVFGRVTTEEGPADPRTAEVELRPLADPGGASPEDLAELEQLTRTAEIHPEGLFQFVGVPPGTFVVEARQPELSPALRSPVTVTRGEWTELEEPLVLEHPLRLALELTPETGLYGEPWTVWLHRSEGSDTLALVAQGRADTAGAWRSPPLPAGPYTVQILDEEGSSLAWRELELAAGSEVFIVDIPLVYVDGRVVLGEEPLQSQVWFGGQTGAERVETETDEDGRFFVTLPHGGEWEVDVRSETPPVTSRGLAVEVEPFGDLRAAEVTIEVPDTRVSGTVVDEVGLPPQLPASVELVPLHGEGRALATEADATGHFEIVGIRPGSYSVEATSGDTSSEAARTEVIEDRETSLALVLRPKRIVAGRVVSDAGPVPGATVRGYALAAGGPPTTAWVPSARTGVDGRFRFRVPAGTTRLRLVTMAPGYALDVTEVTEGSTLQVHLSSGQGGILRLESTSPGATGSREIPLVLVDGRPVDVARLEEWAAMNGTRPDSDGAVAIPAMPPGSYTLCRLAPEEALLVLAGSALPAAGACTEGFLPPGGELTLVSRP